MRKSSDHLGVKIVGGLRETVTPWAGVLLVMDLYRQLEMGETAAGLHAWMGSDAGCGRPTDRDEQG